MRSKHGYICDRDGFTGHTGDINPFKHDMPHTMVFMFSPELGHSMWVDFYHRKRTVKGLIKHLRKAVKRGEYIGYRLITIHHEAKGVEENAK